MREAQGAHGCGTERWAAWGTPDFHTQEFCQVFTVNLRKPSRAGSRESGKKPLLFFFINAEYSVLLNKACFREKLFHQSSADLGDGNTQLQLPLAILFHLSGKNPKRN